MTTNEIYEWLKANCVVHPNSGESYEITKLKEAVNLIEFLMEERDYWKNAYYERGVT